MSDLHTEDREYYFKHPNVMKEFDRCDWETFFDVNDDFDFLAERAGVSDVEFNENINLIEKCGGKLFAHYRLLECNDEPLPKNSLNYLSSLNKDLNKHSIKLLNAIDISSHLNFPCLALDLEYFNRHQLASLNDYGVKSFALYNEVPNELMYALKIIIDGNWKVERAISSGGVTALEFKKLEKEG